MNSAIFSCELGIKPQKDIAAQLKKVDAVKKYMKKVMPYVQMVKERYDLIGERALSLTSPFDEMKILKENSDYITGTLELQGINVSTNYQNAPFSIKTYHFWVKMYHFRACKVFLDQILGRRKSSDSRKLISRSSYI